MKPAKAKQDGPVKTGVATRRAAHQSSGQIPGAPESESNRDHAAWEGLPLGIVQVDGRGRVAWANSSALEMLGVSAAQSRSLDLGHLQTHGRREDGTPANRDDDVVGACLKSGRSQPARLLQIDRPDGSSVWLQFSALPHSSGNSQPIPGVLLCLYDVTARVRRESALRESESMHRGIIEAMHAGMLQISSSGAIIWANPVALQIIDPIRRQLPEDGGQQFFRSLCHTDGKAMSAKNNPIAKCLSAGKPQGNLSLGLRCEDGTVMWLGCTVWPVPGTEPGKPVSAMMAFFDITERQQAEQALRESELRFRQVADCNMVGIIFWQKDGLIHEANDEFLRMLGYTKDDLRHGRVNWRDLTPPEYQPADEPERNNVPGLPKSPGGGFFWAPSARHPSGV